MKERKEKFTPGPWDDDGMGDYIGAPIGDGKIVAQVRGWGWLSKKGEDAALAEQRANAALIAAAPDMYEALKMASERCDRFTTPDEVFAAIDAAIAKALGKA